MEINKHPQQSKQTVLHFLVQTQHNLKGESNAEVARDLNEGTTTRKIWLLNPVFPTRLEVGGGEHLLPAC